MATAKPMSDAEFQSSEKVRIADNAAYFANKKGKPVAEQARLAQKAKDLRKAHEDLYGH